MKVVAITQARIGSSRLPEKILKEINGQSLLEIHLNRLKDAKTLSKIIVATTHEDGVQSIIDIANKVKLAVFQGSLNDVLDRFYQAVKNENVDWVVRVTSDCPLIDPKLIDEVVEYAIQSGADYVCNVLTQSYPDGQDVEVFRFSALKDAWENAELPSEREHVTPYIRKLKNDKGKLVYDVRDYPCSENYSEIRMTVDELRDFDMIEELISLAGVRKSWREYANYIIENQLELINSGIIRNEGYLKSLEKDKN